MPSGYRLLKNYSSYNDYVHEGILEMPTICIAEDRASEADPLKLLLSSLHQHSSENTDIRLFFPAASQEFEQWVQETTSARLDKGSFFGGGGWNIKPAALLSLLDKGHSTVMWVDSDIVVTSDLEQIWAKATNGNLVVTEEPWMMQKIRGDTRTRRWNLPVKRDLKCSINSGVVIVHAHHRPLLERWRDLMEGEQYTTAQAMPFNDRPIHMKSDQDVLTALICSHSEDELPVMILKSGRHIIQYASPAAYNLGDRLSHILKSSDPSFIHAMRRKPWRQSNSKAGLNNLVETVVCETSPYNAAAQTIRENSGLEMSWLHRRSILGRALNVFSVLHPKLVGLPLSVADSVLRRIVLLFNPIR